MEFECLSSKNSARKFLSTNEERIASIYEKKRGPTKAIFETCDIHSPFENLDIL